MGAGASSSATVSKTAWAREDNRLTGPWTFKMKESVQCLCEGASFCTRENPAKQKTVPPIAGLHADWVGDKVLAMARPWQSQVLEHQVVQQFLKHNIGMVLNLQEVGEHANCGPGNLKGGFTYDAETFMSARIGVYNFSWRDMGVPNLDRMMDIVQVMDYVTVTEGRKVAVHCHAGLGRTGLAIACFFVYTRSYSAAEAIVAVRRDRPGALQTSGQVLFVSIFEQLLTHLRCVVRVDPTSRGADVTPGTALAAKSTSITPRPGFSVSGARLPDPARASEVVHPFLQPRQVLEAGGMRTERYGSGLVIVKPAEGRASATTCGGGGGAAVVGAGAGVDVRGSNNGQAGASAAPSTAVEPSGDDAVLTQGLPWTHNFFMRKDEFRADFVPQPPATYYEALKRQQRLLHGTERRSLLYVHRMVMEVVLAIIVAARRFEPPQWAKPPPSRPTSGASTSSARGEERGPSRLSNAGHAETSRAGTPSSPSPPPAAPFPPPSGPEAPRGGEAAGQTSASNGDAAAPSFAAAAAAAVSDEAGALASCEAQAEASAAPLHLAFFGPPPSGWDAIHSAERALGRAVNQAEYAATTQPGAALWAAAPVAALFRLLTTFFTQFRADCLTQTGLGHLASVYQSVPMVPGKEAEGKQFKDAWQVLRALPVADQELLLLLSSLLRHLSRASGHGCEEPLSQVARWLARCVLGSSGTIAQPPADGAEDSPAQEAVMTFLYYLLRNDVAFATLVLIKRARMHGKRAAHTLGGGASAVNGGDVTSQVGSGPAGWSVQHPSASLAGAALSNADADRPSPGASLTAYTARPPGASESGLVEPVVDGGITSQQQVKELVGLDIVTLYAGLP